VIRRNWLRGQTSKAKDVRVAHIRARRGRHRKLKLNVRYMALAGLLVVTAADGPSFVAHPLRLAAHHGRHANGRGTLERSRPNEADGGRPLNLTPPPIPPQDALSRPAPSGSSAPIGVVPGAGIPESVLAAYQRAVTLTSKSEPGCHLPVALLAAIGEVESGQADGGAVDRTGTTLQPILGPVLDGQNGYAAIPNTYGTRWNQSGAWARAVGPMQFIPSTWALWGAGGNPDNVNDAALAAARYLCAGGRDLATPSGVQSAVESYNDSYQYLVTVVQWMSVYSGGMAAIPDSHHMVPQAGGTASATGTGSVQAGRVPPARQAAPAPQAPAAPVPAPQPSTRPASGGAPGRPVPATSPGKTPTPASTSGGLLPAPVSNTVNGVTQIVGGVVSSL
jgi:hypothetical protein